jgi:hypothetical protein
MYDLQDLEEAEEAEEIALKDDVDTAYARSHAGVISASQVYRLASYQPNQDAIEQLKADIAELEAKISNSTNGRVKTATEALETKQRQLDRMLSEELPDGAVGWCEDLAMMRMTGFCEESDVSFDSRETRWGKKYEPMAIDRLEEKYPSLLFTFSKEEQQFIKLDGFENVGATPDSVIVDCDSLNKTRVLDVKCPINRKIHLLKYGRIQSYAQFKRDYPMYYWQGVLQMMCAKVDKFMFASFDPRQKSPNDLFVYEFDLIQEDAEFLLSRIVKAEQLINEIMAGMK